MTAVAHIWNNCVYMQPDTQVKSQVRYCFRQGSWLQGHNRNTLKPEPSWVMDITDTQLKIHHFNEVIVFKIRLIEDDSRPNYRGVAVEQRDQGVSFQIRARDILG